jgi:hypothetical protein
MTEQLALLSREITPETVWATLRGRLGARNGATAAALVWAVTGRPSTAAEERRLRAVVEALRCEGRRICADPSHGYYLAETEDELIGTCEWLYSRAMTTLRQVAAMRRVSLPDLRGQLRLPEEPT